MDDVTIPNDCEASVARAPRDDGAAGDGFDAFFRANYPGTVRLAHLLSGSNAVAEELAQDAFARVYPRFGALQEPKSYLRASTVNACRNLHRGRTREADRFRRHGPSAVVAHDATDELLDTIRSLPYRQRAVLVLRYWLGLSEAEIAESLDCRAGTVKSLHSRALTTLRKDIG